MDPIAPFNAAPLVPTAPSMPQAPRSSVRMVTLFGVTMSLQASLLVVAGLIMAASIIVVFPHWISVIASMGVLLGMLFVAYTVNCTLVGHCQMLAWFFTFVYGMYALAAVIGIFKAKKDGFDFLEPPSMSAKSVKRVLPKSK